ncbi:diacylglycerol kinase family lipid kinase [Taibaiella lutea]|uniref:Diacylglycerol kinase family lipid kinase n=1 Tax=Taibaiella lutea TaxID=2608001 RepID=A0A5M6CDY8_9BACT|nr:diacylglycerol kinase family protein [Taibaiella lutea]KAA5533336.1 diacylglycerol kinase family lipid kinase [Taibaiella lutea]
MSNVTSKRKILFAINKAAGNNTMDCPALIPSFFEDKKEIQYLLFDLPADNLKEALKESIASFEPDIVVAVGGDGTIKLVAEVVMQTSIAIGVIPAGSANGMAKELKIPLEPLEALELIVKGIAKPIHLTRVNNKLCIHLSDIGFNASLVKRFQNMEHRGMWGYVKAAWSELWHHSKMQASFVLNNQKIKRDAVMIVVANATSYGTGITVNPVGKLDDRLFEIIIIRKISLAEILKMRFSTGVFHPEKTEVFQTNHVTIHSRKKVHFQVDGEYYGKVNELIAEVIPDAIKIIY